MPSKALANLPVQSWEIGGISFYPIVEVLINAGVPELLKMDEAAFLRLALGLFTVVAFVRAYTQRKKPAAPSASAADTKVEPSGSGVEPFKASESGEIL